MIAQAHICLNGVSVCLLLFPDGRDGQRSAPPGHSISETA